MHAAAMPDADPGELAAPEAVARALLAELPGAASGERIRVAT